MSENHDPAQYPAPLEADAWPPPQPRKSKKLLIIGASAAGLVLLAAAITVPLVIAEQARKNQITNAADGCLNPHVYSIMDDGDAIEVPGAAKSGGAKAETVFCFLHELGAPESLETKIGQTRSLDGTREAEWGDFSAQWTYHPDDGLNLLVERTN